VTAKSQTYLHIILSNPTVQKAHHHIASCRNLSMNPQITNIAQNVIHWNSLSANYTS